MSEVRNNEMQILIDIIKAFDPEKFIRFFRDKNRSFAPRAEDLFQYDDDNFRNGKKLGEIQFAQGEKMLICAFEASQPLSERSSKKAQYEKGKKILKGNNADSGIFIFHDSNNNFRFSLIYAEYLGVRRRFSYFKRLTFFVSPRLTNKTFLQQIGECDFFSFKNIKEAFSVEPVTKQFYGELQYWYFWAMDKIKFPDDYKYSNDPAKDKEIRNATNLIRLITRIIFIRFLTEKGLIPSELFSGEKLGRIVKDFMKGKKASNFYNAILQNLFFGTLNQKMDERKFAQESGFQTNRNEYGVKNLYRYADKFLFSKDEVLKLFKDSPFLNGGLFDCLDKDDELNKVIYVDGFSRNPAKQTNIPDYLFFQQEEERTDLSKYGLGASRPVRGLFEILNSYNFTIDENTPVDQEIALDPELLGKVFENLLASYNPETATTARKATGSYYTPREIVDYMVQESLLVYLANAINNAPQPPLKLRGGEGGVILPSPLVGEGKGEGDNDPRLRQLLSYSEEIPEFSATERKKIISAIDNIKILDPACGSGAFPMGILHKLVYALQKLDPENKYWHELQYQKALKESEEVFKQDDKNQRQERLKEINEAFDEGINYPDYARKLYLIENCIYGVDIQPIAIQISKLRFFISLVLDQKVDRGKENLGIRALPNLETKFVAANTLIGLDRPVQSVFRNREIEKKEQELKELRHRYFTASTRTQKRRYQEKDRKIREQIANLLINDGWGDATAKKIAAFDLYDQNASAEFFDLEWMFGIKSPSPLAPVHRSSPATEGGGEGSGEGGFDIVIGNPPWGIKFNKDIYTIIKKRLNINKSLDSSEIFIFVSSKFLLKNGVLSFIVPKSILFANNWEISRNFVLSKRILCLGDCGISFETVNLESMIFVLSFQDKNNSSVDIVKFEPLKRFSEVKEKIILTPIEHDLMNKSGFLIVADLNETAQNIIRKIQSQNNFLADIQREIFRGIYISDELKANILDKGGQLFVNKVPDVSMYSINKIRKIDISNLTNKQGDIIKKILRNRIIVKVLRGKRLTCAYAGADILTTEKLVNLIIKEKDISPFYILGFLNSKLTSFYLGKAIFSDITETSRVMDDCYLKHCPIIKLNIKAQQPFITLVDQILSAKKKDPNADTSALERHIDKMVYALYGLTPEEIEIVEGKK